MSPDRAGAELGVRTAQLLGLSRAAVLEAGRSQVASDRYVRAHLAALRAATAVLSTRPEIALRGTRGIWDVLPRVAPEMAGWADRFAGRTAERAVPGAGRAASVTGAEADELLADAETFYRLICSALGQPHPPVLPSPVPACGPEH